MCSKKRYEVVCEVVWPNLDGNPPYEAIYNVFGLFGIGTYWWVHTQEYLYPILVFLYPYGYFYIGPGTKNKFGYFTLKHGHN